MAERDGMGSNGEEGARGSREGSPAGGVPWWKKRGVLPLVVLLALFVVVAVAGGGFLVSQRLSAERQSSLADVSAPEQEPSGTEEPELPANPINFTALKADHPDIYAWISVPDTNVDYPIVQSVVDDNYYLRRDLDGNYALYGSIFTQSMNATDFTDPVTVIYGHNTVDGTMFADLHKFEDKEYFDAHPEFFIYTPGHILTYEVVSAYRYDDRHIMNSFDFSDEQVRREYFDYVLNPTSMVVNVRDGATLDLDDRIVQLSTCPTEGSQSGNRYLVTGVLTSDQATRQHGPPRGGSRPGRRLR